MTDGRGGGLDAGEGGEEERGDQRQRSDRHQARSWLSHRAPFGTEASHSRRAWAAARAGQVFGHVLGEAMNRLSAVILFAAGLWVIVRA